MNRFISLLLVACLLGCDDIIDIDPETGFEVYTISQGRHSSIVRNEPFTGTGLQVTVMFDESARYSISEQNQGDINKLTGFSDCGQHHQSESARFGWRWYEDELQILAYVYRQGTLHWELMGAIPLDEEITLTINIEPEAYLFSGDGLETVSVERSSPCNSGDNYWLWPYFGGNDPAPHTVEIRMKRTMLE